MHTVYLIQNIVTKDIYVGVTSNLKKRLHLHNLGRNHSTHRKSDGDWIWINAEAYRSKEDAYERESKLKQRGTAKQGLRKRIKRSLLEIKK